DLMLRLIQQQPLQAVGALAADRRPPGDRVDVDESKRVQRNAALPQQPYLLNAFEARTKDDADAGQRRRPRRVDEVAHEEIEKADEAQADHERIDEQDRLDA